MKQPFAIPTLLAAFSSVMLLSACSDEVLDFRNAEIVNGKIYEAGDNEPFSGQVTNLPWTKVVPAQVGVVRILTTLLGGRPDATEFSTLGAANTIAQFDAMCDAQVNEGRLDGTTVCSKNNTDIRIMELNYKAGSLDGIFQYFGPQGQPKPVATVSFRNNQPDGKFEIFSATNQKLIHMYSWENGALNGKEETYDENTGETTGSATYVNNRVEGEVIHYAPDGRQVVYKGNFTAGKKNGPEDAYSIAGQHLGHGEWVNGKEHGLFQRWDEQGNLVAQKEWSNGRDVALVTALEASDKKAIDALGDPIISCRYSWEKSYQKKGGEYEPTASMQDQWTDWCKQGKHPQEDDVPSTAAVSETAIDHAAANMGGCVTAWTDAFHQENGNDAMVTVDQLDEWGGWCKQGKHPN